MKYVTMLD